MTNQKLKLLTATALMLAAQSVIAARPYADGDLILGFHATAGQGATKSYTVNLGSAASLSAGNLDLGGDIVADLVALYGPNWNTRTDVKWGISGALFTGTGGLANRTVYVSKAAPAIGTQSTPWLRVSTSTQAPTFGSIQAVSLAYQNGNSATGQVESTTSTKGLTQTNASSPNAFATHMVGGINSTPTSSYKSYINGTLGIENTFAAGSFNTSLDLYRLEPGSVGNPGAFLGSFRLNPAGVLTFSTTGGGFPIAPTVAVSAPTLSVVENAGTVSLLLTRSGDINTTFSVDVKTTAGTAVANLDFTPVNATVTFAVGEPTKMVNISIADLPRYQGDRSFSVAISNPTKEAILGSATTAVTITDDESANPVTTAKASKGGAVPNAGAPGSGIAAGSVWTAFGIPSINDSGKVAYIGSWKAGTVSETGIFVDGALVVKKGDAAPGIAGAAMSGFRDPLLGPDGSVAWIATLANISPATSVTSSNNTAIVLDADGAGPGAAVIVAREGDTLAGGVVRNAFTSVALGADVLSFTGTLLNKTAGVSPGPGGVTSLNDSAFWVYNRATTTTSTALREGGALLGSTIKTFSALVSPSGLQGQGRGVQNDGSADFTQVRVTLADGRQTLGTIDKNGAGSFDYIATNPAVGYGVGALWASFGLPTQNSVSTAAAFIGTLKSGTGTATSTNNVAIFSEDDTTYVAQRIVAKGDTAPGVAGATFGGLKDPVSASNHSVAFVGSMKAGVAGVTSLDDSGIWWNKPGTGLLNVSREGTQAPETAVGAVYKAFTSLALPEGSGPLFLATLAQGPGAVTAADDLGLWGMSSGGQLRLLMREGATFGSSTIKAFTVLSSVSGSAAQTRSFNKVGAVVVRVTDATGAQHIVQIAIP